ncbi:MAG: hypothetical protein QF464_19625, partial [Myxococcota bacterium]|nr:hypothetical protein [Myxococcota bacterium]
SVTRVHEWLLRDGETYTLAVPPSEQLAEDLLIEGHKVLRNVVPIHQALFYDVPTGVGQVEVTTTPMYHPILPLIHDTELMTQSQPFDARPEPAFSYPEDAEAQVWRAVRFYEDVFGVPPRGIWCGEGAVAEEIVPVLAAAGLEWTATDQDVLGKSLGTDAPPLLQPYRVDSDLVEGHGEETDDNVMIVFRHSDLSDRMGFEYWHWDGEDAAQDFYDDVASHAPGLGGGDRLLTVILDGENAWESYKHEHDAKGFHRALYARLAEGYETGEVVTVTTSEYIHGNPSRAITPHPIAEQAELEPLWPGSWIGANFATWIGEPEENKAWGYLRTARADLAASGLPRPNPLAAPPDPSSGLAYEVFQAFELMYAAEGSDWFWWYGPEFETEHHLSFDLLFRGHLLAAWRALSQSPPLELLAPVGAPPPPLRDRSPVGPVSPGRPQGWW